MQPVAIFADSEALLTSYLRDKLSSESMHVSTNVPNPRLEEFIRIMRTGGTVMNVVADRPQFTIECWAMNEERAYEIAALARAHIHALEGTVWDGATFYRMDEFSGPILTSDVELSDMPRYSWTFTIGVRGSTFTP